MFQLGKGISIHDKYWLSFLYLMTIERLYLLNQSYICLFAQILATDLVGLHKRKVQFVQDRSGWLAQKKGAVCTKGYRRVLLWQPRLFHKKSEKTWSLMKLFHASHVLQLHVRRTLVRNIWNTPLYKQAIDHYNLAIHGTHYSPQG